MSFISQQQRARENQQERANNAKRIIARVLHANPNKGYDNPTKIAGSIFSSLINDYMHGRHTQINDLVGLHERMQSHGSLEGTTLHSLKRVMQYLATISLALEPSDHEDFPEVLVKETPAGTYEVTFS